MEEVNIYIHRDACMYAPVLHFDAFALPLPTAFPAQKQQIHIILVHIFTHIYINGGGVCVSLSTFMHMQVGSRAKR